MPSGANTYKSWGIKSGEQFLAFFSFELFLELTVGILIAIALTTQLNLSTVEISVLNNYFMHVHCICLTILSINFYNFPHKGLRHFWLNLLFFPLALH